MLAAIKHGLRNLANVDGRDARQAFWYYVLFVYIVTIGITMTVVLPMTLRAFFTGIQQGIAASQSGDPAAAEAATQAAIMGPMGNMMTIMVWMGVGTGLLMLVFLAAAFVRRLHDSGLSGYWALLPGALQALNTALIPSQFERTMTLAQESVGNPKAGPMAGMTMMGSFGATALLGWSALIFIIVLGVRKSTPGPNRFGETPFVA